MGQLKELEPHASHLDKKSSLADVVDSAYEALTVERSQLMHRCQVGAHAGETG